MKLKSSSFAALAALALGVTVSHAANTVLYSENFNGEGTGGADYNDGTSPEINLGTIGVLQATGISQGGNVADTAWSVNQSANGARGLRFGGGVPGVYNWATGANAATILAAGGFSVSFDYTINGDSSSWACMRVGTLSEESYDIQHTSLTFGALARANGQMQTFDASAADSFGTAGAAATRTAIFNYAFNSWDSGTTVTFTGSIDGTQIATDTFTWNATNDVGIVFGADAQGTLIDNIVVSTIPEPSAALIGGLGMLALLRRRR